MSRDPVCTPLQAALANPSAYPAEAWGALPLEERRVELIETHISIVALTARRAYKLKKPLQLWDLLDYSSPALRRHWCQEEVRLNRRLAPDLYLGVSELVTPSGPEAVVAMRRFDPATSLAARLLAGLAGASELQALGRRIARFHAENPLPDARPSELLRSFARVLHSNLRATRSARSLIPALVHQRLDQQLALALRRQRRVLLQRLKAGWAVEGHGDLRLEHVLMAEPIAVIDGVEFNDRLRCLDGGSDLAFLVMELQATGHAALIPALLEGYDRPIEPAVLSLFCAYRAHVRAKVALAAGRDPRPLLSLALAYAGSGQSPPALILLRGSSGSGKSHLAARLAPWLLADHQQSDRIRKQVHGLSPRQRTAGAERQNLYGPEANRRTEAALLAAAHRSLSRGVTVLLDATHLLRGSRQRAVAMAEALGVPWLILSLETPQSLIEQRLKQRHQRDDDPSDADGAIQAAQRASSEPLTRAEEQRALTYCAGSPSDWIVAPLAGQSRSDPSAGPDQSASSEPGALLMELWCRLSRQQDP